MADCKLFVLVLLLAVLVCQPVQGNIRLVLSSILGCSHPEVGSLCKDCENVCGVDRVNIDCARSCRPGCVCKDDWIRRGSTCIKLNECQANAT
ncbi:hypothetical protein KR018_000803, partial [Drosophila ironensis]